MHLSQNKQYTIDQLKNIKLVTSQLGRAYWIIILNENNTEEKMVIQSYTPNIINYIKTLYKLRSYTTNKFYIEGL